MSGKAGLKLILSVGFFIFSRVTLALQGEYVDLRDHVKYSTVFSKPAHQVQSDLQKNICLFISTQKSPSNLNSVSDSNCNPQVKYTFEGALGPEGVDHDPYFELHKTNEETRKNTVLSVEFDGPDFLTTNNDLTEIKIIMFVHDESQFSESNHYYFKRATLVYKADVFKQIKNENVIPLANTQFSFYADIIERKTIMIDSTNQIIKVFPVAVGAFDIRTLTGMDGFVGSMTEELKDDARLYVGQPAGLHQARRDKPMYKDRPFLGIVDHQGKVYKEIAWHYKMAEGEFIRGFVTHGCMRTDDKDLYQMAAIVFSRTQDYVPIKVVTSFESTSELKFLSSIDHPMPKHNEDYFYVAYSSDNYFSKEKLNQVSNHIQRQERLSYMSEAERYVWCIQKNQVTVAGAQRVPTILRRHGQWSSSLDEYCLTNIKYSNTSAESILSYMRGSETQAPTIEPLQTMKPRIVAGMCKLSLPEAQILFKTTNPNLENPKDNVLTYRTYISNCGCSRFEEVLGQALIRSKEGSILSKAEKGDLYLKYCPAS